MTLNQETAIPDTGGARAAASSISFIVFFLRFTEPGGVTIPGRPGQREQLLLDTDPQGRPQLPGTSLAGALREMVRAGDGEEAAAGLFGRLLPPGEGPEVDAQASRVWVLGSMLEGEPDVAVRASTKISRSRAAAEANTLRTDEVLASGTRFEVFLRWDDASGASVRSFAERLAVWRPLIGHGVSRGRGRCIAEDVRHGTLRLDDPDDLLRWLSLSGPDLARTVATEPAHPPMDVTADDLPLSVPVSIAGPCRTGIGGEPVDQLIPIFRVGDVPVQPGSGLKGLIRSRAEYILRSVGMTPEPCRDQTCGSCWTCHVFGSGGGQNVASTSVGLRSAIRVADAAIENPVIVHRTHNAIDRFTGGVLPTALYTMEAVESGSFTIQVEQLEALPPSRVSEIRAILRLVLEDLTDGLIGVGGGIARGYGSVSVAFGDGELPNSAEARDVLARMVEEQ